MENKENLTFEQAYRRGRELYPDLELRRGTFVEYVLDKPCAACFLSFAGFGLGLTPADVRSLVANCAFADSLKLHFPEIQQTARVWCDFDAGEYTESEMLDRVNSGCYR